MPPYCRYKLTCNQPSLLNRNIFSKLYIMSILPSKIELSMYSAVLQAKTALGGILQRGLGIQIDSVECLDPYPWNKLEVSDRLNGEGITIAIMAQQGGYLLFVSDDGILLPAEYGTTLNDPTQPLPIMANQLQKELQPDASDYVGKRIGKAKVFSSMARRAGVDNSSQILPIKLDIGGQESLIWFVGSVPHPDRAFAKRNPTPESKSKKSKLFSDEILANFTVSSEILNPLPDSEQPTEESTNLLDESCSEIDNKPERHKADLSRLLALKSSSIEDNNEWLPVKAEYPNEKQKDVLSDSPLLLPVLSDEKLNREPAESDCQQDETDQTISPLLQSSLITDSCPVDMEQDVVIVQGDSIPEEGIPELVSAEDVAPENVIIPDCADVEENAVLEDNAQEDLEDDYQVVSEDDSLEDTEDDVQEDAVEASEDDVLYDAAEEEAPELTSEDGDMRYTVHSAHIDYPVAHRASLIPSHAALKMPVTLDAVVSRRSCLVQEILSWKPGKVIEFDDIQPTITLESNGVVLGHGKPIEQNMRIGIQLE